MGIIKSLGTRIQDLADALRRPGTLHFHVLDEPRTLCGKSSGGNSEAVQLLDTNPVGSTYPRSYAWGYYSDIDHVMRLDHRMGKSGHRLDICGPCTRAWPARVAENAARRLRAAPPPPPPRIRRAELLAMEAGILPQRPREPGTEEMTGHLDEDSKGGGCGEASVGFLTTFLPWVSCGACQVMADWVLENGLFILHGNYLVKSPSNPPGFTITLVPNRPSQPPGFHYEARRDWQPKTPPRP